MGLPYDYARCTATTHQNCQVCQRNTSGHSTWQSYIGPQIGLDGQCPNFIGPQAVYMTNNTATKEPGNG